MKERMISRGDLFYYDFGERVGSVQSGERPVLVVQADDYNKNAPTVIVAAVTSVIKKRYLPSHIILGDKFGLKKPSMVLLEQVQTVNKDELSDYIGTIEDEHLLRHKEPEPQQANIPCHTPIFPVLQADRLHLYRRCRWLSVSDK